MQQHHGKTKTPAAKSEFRFAGHWMEWIILLVVGVTFILVIVALNQVIRNYNNELCQDPVLDTTGQCPSTSSCTTSFVCRNPLASMPTVCETKPLPNNTACSDSCVVPSTGKCQSGGCTGICGGSCDSPLDFGSASCPNLTFVPSVQEEVYDNPLLFYGQVCFYGKCIWTLEWPIVGQFACEDNVDSIFYNVAASKQALDFLSDQTDNKKCFKASILCSSSGTPLIMYEYTCSSYDITINSTIPATIDEVDEEQAAKIKESVVKIKTGRFSGWNKKTKRSLFPKSAFARSPILRNGPIKGGSFSSLNAFLYDETYPETEKRSAQAPRKDRRRKKNRKARPTKVVPPAPVIKTDIPTDNNSTLTDINDYVKEVLGCLTLGDFIKTAFELWHSG